MLLQHRDNFAHIAVRIDNGALHVRYFLWIQGLKRAAERKNCPVGFTLMDMRLEQGSVFAGEFIFDLLEAAGSNRDARTRKEHGVGNGLSQYSLLELYEFNGLRG